MLLPVSSGLQGLAHWLPEPAICQTIATIAPALLIGGLIYAIAKFLPERWWLRLPERPRELLGGLGYLPLLSAYGLLYITGAACLLYFLFGWSGWLLAPATIGFFILWGVVIWITGKPTPEQPRFSHGSATWQTVESAQQAGRIIEKGLVLKDSWGFLLGRFDNVPATHDPRLRYMGHILTCAPTGAGKGIGAVIPNLLEYPGSALVLDIKGENYAVTHRTRATLGHAIFRLDPFGVAGQPGHALNWLDTLNPDDPNVVSDSATLADMMIVSDAKDSYWDDAARDLIRGLLIHVAGLPETDRHMGTVRHLLTGGEERLNLVLQEMADSQAGFGIVARTAHSFLIKADRERSGVLSTAIRHTAFLDDPRIVESLSRSDFDLRDLKRKPMTVFVILPPTNIIAYNRFLRAVVGLSLAAVTY